MKHLLLTALCALLAGCEFSVPLVESPATDADPALLGLWQRRSGDGQVEKLLLLPLSEREYLVSWPAGHPDGLFARACLTQVGDIPLAQIKWLGTAAGSQPSDSRVFQFAHFKSDGNQLTIRLLNADVVGRDAPSSDALREAILRNKSSSGLFREPMVFQRESL